MSPLVRIPIEYGDLAAPSPLGPLGHPARWHARTPRGDIWQRWADHKAALWGDGLPEVLILNDALDGRTASPAVRTHEAIPARHGLRLVVGTQTGVIDQPGIRFVFDPRAFTRRGQLVRARLGDAEWTMRLWRSNTMAVDRDHHRIAQAQGKRRWELDPAADALDIAVALALLSSVSSAARPIW